MMNVVMPRKADARLRIYLRELLASQKVKICLG
jgi:hypothetical protein